ncbi:MAG: hypothetical protein V3T72_17925 [Thermoanaerobaculia bacterium]
MQSHSFWKRLWDSILDVFWPLSRVEKIWKQVASMIPLAVALGIPTLAAVSWSEALPQTCPGRWLFGTVVLAVAILGVAAAYQHRKRLAELQEQISVDQVPAHCRKAIGEIRRLANQIHGLFDMWRDPSDLADMAESLLTHAMSISEYRAIHLPAREYGLWVHKMVARKGPKEELEALGPKLFSDLISSIKTFLRENPPVEISTPRRDPPHSTTAR